METMRIGFIILRDTFLKDFGSLITSSLENGHDVILFYDSQAAPERKNYQRVSLETLSVFSHKHVEKVAFNSLEIVEKCEETSPQILITIDGKLVKDSRAKVIAQLKKRNIKLVSLGSFFETALLPMDHLHEFDLTLYLSEYARNLHFIAQGNAAARDSLKRSFLHKSAVTSSPIFDQLLFSKPGGVRKHYGIPN